MNKLFLTFLSVILISTLSFAEMNLKLKSEFFNNSYYPTLDKNLESNLNLNIPAEVANVPADMKELVKGLILLGVLGDVSFPFGDSDSGFKHIAGTAWSGHVEFSYFASPMFRIMVRAGYINFGKQTTDDDFGDTYEDTFSQIPILVGGYYMIPTGSGFKPYIGVALGVYFQTWKVNWAGFDDSFSNTGFGVVPGLGAYYMAGSVLVQLAVEYTYIFSDAPTAEYTYDYGFGQETYEETPSDKPSYFSVVAGVSFPLGH